MFSQLFKHKQLAPRLRLILVLALALGGVVLLKSLGFYGRPVCPWLQLSGTHCPGCGGERALGSLARGDLLDAAQHNALVVLAIPLMLIWLYDGYRGGNWFTGRVWLGLAALMLVFAVLRNLPGVGWLGP